MNSKNSVVVVGAQWGDEGKGKVVDLYSANADLVVRYQGGNNAGHTLVVAGKKTVLHLIPSGVLHAGKRCLIAGGVVFDAKVFFEEIDALVDGGVLGKSPWDQVVVSDRAHVILPYHRELDRLREEKAAKTKGKIGTTVRGIGPAYEDKIARRGIQVGDLLRPELLRTKLERALEEKNTLFKHHFGAEVVDIDPLYNEYLKLGERLKPFVQDVRSELVKAVSQGKKILFEGAQGTLLDVDYGTYPYVTSSNTIAGGASCGTGLGPALFQTVVGITKAYATRVGTGPFPSEIEESEPEIAKKIRAVGAEFGATTGRPRRVGWLDLVALRYAVEVNGITGLALMKADCLQGLGEIRVCTAYRLNGKEITQMPSNIEDIEKAEPVFKTVPCWEPYDPGSVKKLGDFPKALQDYCKLIEKEVGVPIVLMSSGPGREQTLQFHPAFT